MIVTREIRISNFEGWSGAEDTIDRIIAANKEDEFDAFITEQYPDGIDETNLNDLLRFEDDYVFRALGIAKEEGGNV
jgi:hypothetical protein